MSSKTPSMKLTKPDVNDKVSDTIAALAANFDILDAFYPLGTIYQSTRATNPGTFLGGSWTQLQGRVLVGQSSDFPSGTTGGEKTHILSTAEIPSHTHEVRWSNSNDWIGAWKSDASGGGKWNIASTYSGGDTSTRNDWAKVTNTGSGKAHNNMPPYRAVYMWERTA